MSISLGKKQGSQRGETNVDPETQARMKQMWDAAQAAGKAGPSPLVTGASDYNSGLMRGGNLGLGALMGDKGSVSTLMDPYQQQVIDANNAQWGRVNQQTQNQVNDRATAAGAFGGTRQAVATGTALSANNVAQGAQTAGLLSSGYSDAMQRAQALASGGFAGAGANANLGMGGVGNPQQWLLQMMKMGYLGPQGSSFTGHDTGVSSGAQFDPLKYFAAAGGGG